MTLGTGANSGETSVQVVASQLAAQEFWSTLLVLDDQRMSPSTVVFYLEIEEDFALHVQLLTQCFFYDSDSLGQPPPYMLMLIDHAAW